jgi:hypothetical protein
MIDLDKLEQDREAACIDKSDLFDFYNTNWDKLVAEIRSLRDMPRTVACPECIEYGECSTHLSAATLSMRKK